ncbi:hypothetical protein [Sphingomicrobium arenosum]|uniref:hypothetical protein n=1 Tax=Sphingomicrobium arenosum TaxID=2233861 RepID=UPI002240F1D7|nr:hypothetical protein [Sphingomicrobium arenosum]
MGVILIGFWPSYWSVASSARWEHHFHGLVSSLWVILVATQSWTAHRKSWGWHRMAGKASLTLFPFLIAGLFAVEAINAKAYDAGEGFLLPTYGPAFLFGLGIAAAAYVTLYYRALSQRRKVWSHAAYMLGTPMILFESPAGRALNLHVPGFLIEGPQHVGQAMVGILVSDALMVLLALALWWRARARSNAFLVAAGFIGAQMLLMAALYYGAGVGSGFGGGLVRALALVPTATMIGIGFAIGAASSWLGWQAGKRQGLGRTGALAA